MMFLILSISLSFILAYLLGSIPAAYILGKTLKQIDIREYGSGNVGATNALRVLGTKVGLIVLVIDILKGVLAVMIARYLLSSQWLIVLVGLVAIFGHIYTCFLGFKGGKGVATAAGVCLSLIPQNLIFALIVFAIVLAYTKYVSLSSIIAAIFLAFIQGFDLLITVLYTSNSNYSSFGKDITNLVFVTVIVVFVLIKHIPNIKRLIQGNENKISFKKKEKQNNIQTKGGNS